MTALSVIILTKNSSKTISKCLESVGFADEVIVIDDSSTDNTVSLAKSFGATVYHRNLVNDFSSQRNYGIQKAQSEWILFVDSDEIVSHDLRKEVETVIRLDDGTVGYFFKRHDVFLGKTLQHGEIGHVRLLRLGKSGGGNFVGTVHEIWDLQGRTKELASPLLHYAHPTVGDFVADVNRYSSLRAKELYKAGESVSWFHIVAFPLGKCFVNFVLRNGYKDGIHGLVVALIMSFHSFLVQAKLWKLHHDSKT